jgi:hypothetical protein
MWYLLMGRYLTWTMIPATLLAGLLQSWLGNVGIPLTFVILLIGWILWIKLFDDEK